MIRNLIIIFLWFVTVIASIIWTYENPEKIEKIKNFFEKKQEPKISQINEDNSAVAGNSFNLNLRNVLAIDKKTAFITHPLETKFDLNKLAIFTQNGFKIKNSNFTKLILPDDFTLQRNGGVKTIINFLDKEFAFISLNNSGCFYSAIVDTSNGSKIFETECLPEEPKNNDFNGLGSSNIQTQKSILLTIGTPEKHKSKNSILAQLDESKYGKILEFNKDELKNKISDNSYNLTYKIFSKGHRVPQGITLLKEKIYSVEHGPKGGDELNLIEKGKNYGWPIVSYGTNYLKSSGGDGVSFPINHSIKNFTEPLFAFVPSVGIASLNKCPKILNKYYKKPCLIATSLFGNQLRKGNSLIIFLLNEEQNIVQSIEKIKIHNLILRHFVTNKKNELYEDIDGSIYVSADYEGIYKISFSDFR